VDPNDFQMEMPRISLLQRLREILHESPTKSMTFHQMLEIHNRKWPQYKNHVPSPRSISLRFTKSICIRYDDTVRGHLIAINMKLPENPDCSYLTVTINPSWTDKNLIPHLVRHISQITGKHIADAFIPTWNRLGFFTAKHEGIARSFIKRAAQKKFKCGGRSVTAEIIPLPKHKVRKGKHKKLEQEGGYRVRVDNVNCVMGRKDFSGWVRSHTQIDSDNVERVDDEDGVYDIEIVFPKQRKGASQCILMVDTPHDAVNIIHRVQNSIFRGESLHFEHWIHPSNTLEAVDIPVISSESAESPEQFWDESYFPEAKQETTVGVLSQ